MRMMVCEDCVKCLGVEGTEKRTQNRFYVFMHDQLSWLEHLPYKQGVTGSNPVLCTIVERFNMALGVQIVNAGGRYLTLPKQFKEVIPMFRMAVF